MASAAHKLSPSVVDVLRNSFVGEHIGSGTALILPPYLLDRKLYLEVAEAAKLLGCTWNRKAQALIAADLSVDQLAEALAQALDLGEIVDRVKAMQFYETPPALAKRLIEAAGVKPGDRVLEPSCGRCAIARQLPLGVEHVGLIELDPAHAVAIEAFAQDWGPESCDRVIGGDFLRERLADLGWDPFDAVVMNPPFANGAAVDHIVHALGFLRPGGRLAAVAPASVAFRTDAKHRAFRERIAQHCRGYMVPLPNDSFAPATRVRTVLVTLEKAP